jgi:hypothetical protein
MKRRRRASHHGSRFEANPYAAVLHARRVVGRFGSPAVQRRMKEAQAILYRVEAIAGHEVELRGVVQLLRRSGVALMKAAAYLAKAANRGDAPAAVET